MWDCVSWREGKPSRASFSDGKRRQEIVKWLLPRLVIAGENA
jgi:hypothetical protein